MRKRKLGWIFLAVFIYALGVGVVVFVRSLNHPDYFSSPDESRDTIGYVEDSSVGLLEKRDWKIEETRPASEEMVVPVKLEGVKSDFILNWKGEKPVAKTGQVENWSAGLEGDDKLELAAVATWYPMPDDDISEEADWMVKLQFYDAKTLELIPHDQLKKQGVPDDFLEMKPPTKYLTPRVRLLFKSENMEYVRFIDGEGGDMNTEAAVTYNLESLIDGEQHSEQEGDWSRLDMAWLTWIDSPVKFHIRVLTGEPQRVELPQERGAQVVFDDLLRLQWLGHVNGSISRKSESMSGFAASPRVSKKELDALNVSPSKSESTTPATGAEIGASLGAGASALIGSVPLPTVSAGPADPFAIPAAPSYSGSWSNADTAVWIEARQPADYYWQANTLFRASSEAYCEHTGWIRKDGRVEWNWEQEVDNDHMTLTSTRQLDDTKAPIQLVFLPKVTELTFEVKGIPGAPNTRENTLDLFDVKIPRLTLPEGDNSAEDRLFQIIGVATQTGWDITNRWDDEAPSSFPLDRTFRDMTPQELINYYVDVTNKGHIKYDEEDKVIFVNKEEETLWEKAKNYFTELWYEYGF